MQKNYSTCNFYDRVKIDISAKTLDKNMNTFGRNFRITTFGESHGVGLGAIIDGVPAGLEFSCEEFQADLNRRKPGQSAMATPRNEKDQVEVLSGIFEGKTIGTPIACVIKNQDQKSKDYDWLRTTFRPGHSDEMWHGKFGHRDHRGGGRSSGRETIGRVLGGAIAKKLLKVSSNCEVYAHVSALAGVESDPKNFDISEIEKNPVRCADKKAAEKMVEAVMNAKANSESVGGEITILVKNPPKFLGAPVFGKMEGEFARALLSCGAVRSFEFGSGSSAKNQKGSVQNTLHEGISGGILTGEDFQLKISVKPTPSISQKQTVKTTNGDIENFVIGGRHDPTIPPRLAPVVEGMVAMVLADFLLAPADRMDQIIAR